MDPSLAFAPPVRPGLRSPTGVPLATARRFAILTCLEAHLDPVRLLGLDESAVHLVRSPGGRATEAAIAALLASYTELGTREWFVIRHTGCALALPSGLRASYADLLASVADDVACLRRHPRVPAAVPLYGYLCDAKTQQLVEVPAATRLGQPRP